MREIKFRGWHVPKQVMFSAEEMAIDQLTLLPTGCFINVSCTSTKLSQIIPQDKFIPLQYTGLKDKNGVEIYEGDILAQESFISWVIVWAKCGFYAYNLHNSSTIYPLESATNREVIGNIYEHPELITSIKEEI